MKPPCGYRRGYATAARWSSGLVQAKSTAGIRSSKLRATNGRRWPFPPFQFTEFELSRQRSSIGVFADALLGRRQLSGGLAGCPPPGDSKRLGAISRPEPLRNQSIGSSVRKLG